MLTRRSSKPGSSGFQAKASPAVSCCSFHSFGCICMTSVSSSAKWARSLFLLFPRPEQEEKNGVGLGSCQEVETQLCTRQVSLAGVENETPGGARGAPHHVASLFPSSGAPVPEPTAPPAGRPAQKLPVGSTASQRNPHCAPWKEPPQPRGAQCERRLHPGVRKHRAGGEPGLGLIAPRTPVEKGLRRAGGRRPL